MSETSTQSCCIILRSVKIGANKIIILLWSQTTLLLRLYREAALRFEIEELRAKSYVQRHRVRHFKPCYMHILKHRTISIDISLSVAMLWRDRKLSLQNRIYFMPSNRSVNFWRSNGLPFRTKVKMLCTGNDNKCCLLFKSCFMLRSVGTQLCFRSVYRHKLNRREVKFQPGFKSGLN